MNTEEGPIPDSYWVVPGRLLAGEYPGSLDDDKARRKVCALLSAGVTVFLDLTTQRELLEPYASFLEEEANALARPARYERLAIPDQTAPAPDLMVAILDKIDTALGAGQTVYVHCWGGIGRTGTVVGCYLVRHGMCGQQALRELARLRQGTPDARKSSPETLEQKEIVLNWPAGG